MVKRRRITHKKTGENHKRKQLQRIVILAVTLILLFLTWRERRYLYKFEHLGYFGLFAFNVLSNATVFIPIPGFVTSFIAGSIWNPFLVGVVAGVGSAIGELVGFFLGFGGRGIIDNLRKDHKSKMRRVEAWFRKSGFVTIFLASILPDPFFDLVGVVSGTLDYPIYKFFAATALGRIIRNIILAWSGAKIIP